VFESLQVLSGNLVVPIVYRATSVLMKAYHDDSRLLTIAASADEANSTEPKRASGRSFEIDSEVDKLVREIENKEQKPLERLTQAEVSNYVSVLSDIATQRAAKTFVGSSISSSQAREILIRLREYYR
jgi:hypothetical protein